MILKIIETLSDGFLILDQDKEVLFFNEVLLQQTGWRSRDILVDRRFLEYISPDTCRIMERLAVIPGPEGEPRHFRVAAFPVEAESGEYTLVRIRLDARSAEAAGRGEAAGPAERYESLFRNFGDPLFTANLKGRVITANPALYRLLEQPADQEIGNIEDYYVYHEDLDDKLLRLLEQDVVYNLETHLYTTSRAIRRVLDSSWVIRNPDGVVVGYTSQFKDVSYLKNLEARLKISERNYSLLFDTLLTSIVIVDPLGDVVNWNYTASQLYGYRWDEVAGQSFDALFGTGEGRLQLPEIFRRVGESQGRYVEAEAPRRRKDGSLVYTYASYSEIRNTSGELVAYSIIEKDLTERVNLERKLKDSFDQLKETQDAAILGFARLTEYRDKDTGKHLKRIREYTKVLATSLRGRKDYRKYITDRYIEDLCLSAILHDVGKVAIPDSILLKPGKLTEGEFTTIKEHSRLGGDALSDVDREINRESFLTLGKEIAYYHHERWDGTGYPKGLAGTDIPLSARIVALADVYDALTSDRPYKGAMSHEEALELIVQGRGTQFDPDVVDAFLQNQQIFRSIMIFNEFEEHPERFAAVLGKQVEEIPPTTDG
ncbi:MAG: PAS domain S-box protein [Spirochaetales bacterium]|nr:PAS domain S-box protein [Spirochaetales bacterium]